MDERIRELLLEAREQTAEGKWRAPTDVWAQKFAELIVQECASIGYDASYDECALNVSVKIKEHFGLK